MWQDHPRAPATGSTRFPAPFGRFDPKMCMVDDSRTAYFPGVLLACALGLVATLACQPAQTGTASRGSTSPETRGERHSSPDAIRDLSQDESAGGHTLRKHVGRSDDELRQRLRRERNISAASTWTDRETAERAVGAAITQNRDKIDRWMSRTGGHPNLAIDYDGDSSHPIGRSLRRDADRPEPCSHATIVLKWSGPDSYYVLTSYPECRA